MTQRQARNILTWCVLLPITIAVWAQFLPPCVFGCVQKSQERVPQQQPPPKAALPVICPFAPPCWKDGKPINGAL